MNKLDYSVLMSVYYNDKIEYLEVAISSILNQTIIPYEIIIVLDGPIKNEIISYINQIKEETFHIKIQIIHITQNLGLGNALNFGLKYVNTNWILRMDADDFSIKTRAQDLINYVVENPNVKIVGSYIGDFKDNSLLIERIMIFPKLFNTNKLKYYIRDPIGHATILIEKNLLESAGLYNINYLYFEDTELWFRIGKLIDKFHTLPKVLYLARVDDRFYSRRSGLNYFKYEFHAFIFFYKSSYITFLTFLSNVSIRLILRLLPSKMLSYIFIKFLRKTQNGN